MLTRDAEFIVSMCDFATSANDVNVARAALTFALNATKRLANSGQLTPHIRWEIEETQATLAARGWR